ncbi:MAG: divergent polysaccharide deacetylase family protein [Treponema sp.]|nr:divergent polysaccharide deacetylase family protein [Treponema sp.]
MPTKKAPSKKKKSPKPKVRLSAKKVYILCAVIVLVCAGSLATSVFLAQGTQTVASAKPDVTEKPSPAPEKKMAPSKKPEPEKNPVPASETKKKAPSEGASRKPAPVPAPAPTPLPAPAPAPAQKSTPAKSSPAGKSTPAKPVPKPTPDAKKAPRAPVPVAPAPAPAPVKPADPFNIPQAKNGATLVFVIDDAGLHVDNVKKYTALPFPLTVAVLPKLSHTKECAAQVRRDGKELMLHQPMQAVNLSINPGAGKISPDMNTYQIAAQIKENIAELGGGVKGFNNHEGSLITEDEIKMGAVLETAASEGVYFLDSRTSAQSKARQAALERDMHIYERNAPFLDNAVSREEMLSEIMKSLAVANKAGYAIIIGHVDKSADILPKLLADMYPYLKQKGYRFATPGSLPVK